MAAPVRVVDACAPFVTDNDGMSEPQTGPDPAPRRTRMTAAARREQLVDVGRRVFAAKGVDGTSVEDLAATAGVSKPVVYEHFGGKEGLYAVVVDRELRALTDAVTASLTAGGSDRETIERAALALLDYIEDSPDGFRILVRDVSGSAPTGTYASLLSDVAAEVAHLLSDAFEQRELESRYAPMYRPDARRSRLAHRSVVARDARAAQGGRRGAHGQPRVARPVRSRPAPQPDARHLTRSPLSARPRGGQVGSVGATWLPFSGQPGGTNAAG